MTLADCVTRLRTRLKVDLESEVDLSDSNEAAKHLLLATRQVSRRTYAFYDTRAVLTIAAQANSVNLLDPAQCSSRIFECDGIYINKNWLTKSRQSEFYDNFPDYLTVPASSPSYWTPVQHDRVMFDVPLNAGAAASQCIAKGWREHVTFAWQTYQSTEMEGPDSYHLLYVNQAALNLTPGTVSGSEAFQRRAMIKAETDSEIESEMQRNLAQFRDLRKAAVAGATRRYWGIGGWGYF